MEDAGGAHTVYEVERLIKEGGGIREYAKRLERDARRAPYDPASYCRAALMQAEAGRHGRAVRLLREVLRSDPDNAPALAIMGTAYTYAGRPARAARLCSRAIRLDPSLSFAYCMRGKAMARLGRPRAALRMFRAAVRLDPGDYDSYESMGLALAVEGRHMRAAACFRRAAAIEPRAVFSMMLAGHCLGRSGRHEDAVAEFDRAIEAAPGVSFVHYLRGVSLSALDRHAEAAASHEAAAEADPGNPLMWAAKAFSCARAGMVERGRDSLEKAAALRRAGSRPRLDDLDPLFGNIAAGPPRDVLAMLGGTASAVDVDMAIEEAREAVAAAEADAG